ncbi:zinc finger CCCH domain-containing protein 50 [Scenedesmus sp. PABB004]|nr:zinc finger CCCH domain-containing protein 50 [Scenedesmus sp. PABB004]
MMEQPLADGARPAKKPAGVRVNKLPLDESYMMYSYKMVPCSRVSTHNWKLCHFCHVGEVSARRRHPYFHKPDMCEYVNKKLECPFGDKCAYAHNTFEAWLHPERYRTALCSFGASCSRKFCFFAHCPTELRMPSKALPPALPRAHSLDSADSVGTPHSVCSTNSTSSMMAAALRNNWAAGGGSLGAAGGALYMAPSGGGPLLAYGGGGGPQAHHHHAAGDGGLLPPGGAPLGAIVVSAPQLGGPLGGGAYGGGGGWDSGPLAALGSTPMAADGSGSYASFASFRAPASPGTPLTGGAPGSPMSAASPLAHLGPPGCGYAAGFAPDSGGALRTHLLAQLASMQGAHCGTDAPLGGGQAGWGGEPGGLCGPSAFALSSAHGMAALAAAAAAGGAGEPGWGLPLAGPAPGQGGFAPQGALLPGGAGGFAAHGQGGQQLPGMAAPAGGGEASQLQQQLNLLTFGAMAAPA